MTRLFDPPVADVAVPARALSGEMLALPGRLAIPDEARGLVVFAHGSGSGRSSPRNRLLARVLHEARLGTLLFDLLTPLEAADRINVFDVGLLADRVLAAVAWTAGHAPTASLPLGLCGASTGAAAALVAAAREPRVRAVVSRGGRPDLAEGFLERVRVPVLLVVGSLDESVLELNERALERLGGERRLAVVPGATHLFEERGTLEEAARLAAEWFSRVLVPS